MIIAFLYDLSTLFTRKYGQNTRKLASKLHRSADFRLSCLPPAQESDRVTSNRAGMAQILHPRYGCSIRSLFEHRGIIMPPLCFLYWYSIIIIIHISQKEGSFYSSGFLKAQHYFQEGPRILPFLPLSRSITRTNIYFPCGTNSPVPSSSFPVCCFSRFLGQSNTGQSMEPFVVLPNMHKYNNEGLFWEPQGLFIYPRFDYW